MVMLPRGTWGHGQGMLGIRPPGGREGGRQHGELDKRFVTQMKRGSSPDSVWFGHGLTFLSLYFLTVKGQGQNLPPASKKGCAVK